MNGISGSFSSIEAMTGQYFSSSTVKKGDQCTDISFEDILKQKESQQVMENSSLNYSKHASQRVMSRNLSMTEEVNNRLETSVNQAEQKGIKESLVLVDSMAFIVNVPNRTVVTAMDQAEANGNVFTNIDGAVIG